MVAGADLRLAGVGRRSYDVEHDPEGLVRWSRIAAEYAQQFPLLIQGPINGLDDVFRVLPQIVGDFRHMIENRGLNNELYRENGTPRKEVTAQRLFHAMAWNHCRANNADISPETDVGTGRIDFKFSRGFEQRVLVEIKLSTNPNVITGYQVQLETYRQAEQTTRAIYLVIDVGRMGTKDDRLIAIRNRARADGQPLSELEFIDGSLRPSASKRR